MSDYEYHRRSLNRALLDRIRAEHGITPVISEAFRQVLRDDFIDHLFVPERQHAHLKPRWRRMDRWSDLWLESVYTDTALVTEFDEQGLPVSSSTAPWLMALMLEALAPRPGSRVLEIGTGTGYNAALLGHLVGPAGQVVTMDIDERIVHRASLALARHTIVEPRVQDVAGPLPGIGRFDAVIVTAGLDRIPEPLFAALAPGGVLVASLQRPLVSSLVRLERSMDGVRYTGEFVGERPADFMPLRVAGVDEAADLRRLAAVSQLPARPADLDSDTEMVDAVLRGDRGFMWFLQAANPDLRLVPLSNSPVREPQRAVLVTDDAASALSIATSGDEPPSMHGSARVACALAAAWSRWSSAGLPDLPACSIAVAPSGSLTTVAAGKEFHDHWWITTDPVGRAYDR